MLYLKSLTLSRFKSFKHSELLFSKGFTCVVGPNGSGKSNICDALLFGLGENSLHRLRVSKLESLISASASKGADGYRKAIVKIELGGDESVSVVKTIRSDGKSAYRLNGKRMTKQEAMEYLGRHGVHADETNTITQGEINRLVDLNPKERRQLIDIASGIEEFEYKKNEAMKELEKVSQRISECHAVLNERTGFLNELAAEREAAQKYLEMSSRLKSLNYSVLITKKSDSEASLTEQRKAMALVDQRKNELARKLESLTKKIEELNLERKELTGEIGSRAKAMGEVNARLEAVRIELARLEMDDSNRFNAVADAEKTAGESRAEQQKADVQVRENLERISALEKQIQELEKSVGKYKVRKEDLEGSDYDINQLTKSVKESESEVSELQDGFSDLKTSLSLENSNKSNKLKEIESVKSRMDENARRNEVIVAKAKDASQKLKSLRENSKGRLAKMEKIKGEALDADEQIIRLKEQKAMTQSRVSAVYDKIKGKFNDEDGLYGKVSDLCTYDAEHSYAVETAAASRFDYIVVDCMETASRIIEYLKENNLGRATFIPIRELKSDSEAEKVKNAQPVIDVIRFEQKLRKVFSYVFSNTYLVESIKKARELGIGEHRYVTLAGELVEQSGVLSGGTPQRRVSTAQIEKQIREFLERSSRLKKDSELENELLVKERKEEAYSEMEIKSLEKESGELERSLKADSESLSVLEKESKGIESRIDKLTKEISGFEERRAESAEKLGRAKDALAAAYKSTIEVSRKLSEYGLSKEELERLEALKNELESSKIRKAEAMKENQMLEEKISALKKQIKEREKAIESANKAMKANEEQKKASEKAKREIEKEIMSGDDSNKRVYLRLNELDSEIGKLTADQNKVNNDYSMIERQLTELAMRKSQIETRINDLNAELSVYKDAQEVVKGNVERMEREVIVLNSKISELGNVNLKAPEIYEEKRRMVEEAQGKVDTLEAERHAVIRMMEEIDSKKLQTFMSTLNEIAKNFSRLYSYILPGKAMIRLGEEKDPFSSGLEIAISEGNKRTKLLGSMSGGEKSLISLVLIFAIHMCKPSSLYIFDEVDAALDKENSKKLSQLIKEMSKDAQFIVVSHNDSLIVNSDTAIGVMKSTDESKAIGIEISSIMNRSK